MKTTLHRAEKWIKKGKYQKALSLLLEMLRENDDAHLYYLAGESYRLDGNTEEAISMLQKAVIRREDSAPYWLTLGIAYYSANYFVRAVEALGKAKKYDPEEIEVYRHLGVVYQKVGNHKKSLQWYKRAKEMHWHKVMQQIDDGLLEAKHKKKSRQAMVHMIHVDKYYAALKKDAVFSVLNNEIGMALMSLGRYEEALENLKKAIEFIPEQYDYYDPYRNFYEASRQCKARRKSDTEEERKHY